MVRAFKVGAIDGLVNFFDITLVQNLDTIKLIVKGRDKVVSRIGGTRTFGNITTRFDDELSQVGAIIATNQRLYELGNRVNDNTSLIPNGIDLELFKPRSERQTPYDDNGYFTAGFAGNISGKMCMYYKGWKYFVEATSRLFTEIKTKTFLFQRNQIPHDQMPKQFYHQIDCLVLPSIDEGCSNVTVEALACGVPVLTTKVGFHGERLEDGVNCLFIERDAIDIAEKIMTLVNTPELRSKLAFEGRIFAENHHDIDKIAHEYDRVFKDVLKRNNNTIIEGLKENIK